MRTKTLLTAVAALAATVISSQAQVYSGIVGYVSVVEPSGQFVLQENPMTTGNDVLTNVIPNPTGASQIDVWNGTGFVTYQYSALSHNWTLSGANENNTPLPPGVGFFLKAGTTSFTNTYVGTVLAATDGSSVTNVLSNALNPVGSLIPIGDVVTNPATINLNVAGGTTLQQWSVPNQAFTVFQYSTLSHAWKSGSPSVVTNPVIGVGEGFFIQPASATNWVETLP